MEPSVQPLTVVISYLLCHALFPSRTSVTVSVISLPWVKYCAQESLSMHSNLPEHNILSFTSKRSSQLQPHQHKKGRGLPLKHF